MSQTDIQRSATSISAITVGDIDSAPSNVPDDSLVDWRERHDQLDERFRALADEHFLIKEENSTLKQVQRTRALLDSLIIPFANKTFVFMCIYCAFAGIVLLACGINDTFSLSDNVLELLVGSTATTVISLVGMVLTGVFIGARSR